MAFRGLMGASLVLLGLGTVACEEKNSGFTVGKAEGDAGCQLTYDQLPDSEWLFLRAQPDKSEGPDTGLRKLLGMEL